MILMKSVVALTSAAMLTGGVGCQNTGGRASSDDRALAKAVERGHNARVGERVEVWFERVPANDATPGTTYGPKMLAAGPLAALGVAAISSLVGIVADQVKAGVAREVSLHQATFAGTAATTDLYKVANDKITLNYRKLRISRSVPTGNNKGLDAQPTTQSAFDATFKMTLRGQPEASQIDVALESLSIPVAAAKLEKGKNQPFDVEITVQFHSSWRDETGKWHDVAIGQPIVTKLTSLKVNSTVAATAKDPVYAIPAPFVPNEASLGVGNLRAVVTVTETDQSQWPKIRQQIAIKAVDDLQKPVTNVLVEVAGLATTQPAAAAQPARPTTGPAATGEEN